MPMKGKAILYLISSYLSRENSDTMPGISLNFSLPHPIVCRIPIILLDQRSDISSSEMDNEVVVLR